MKFSNLKLTAPYLELDSIFYDRVEPTPLHKPFLISTSQSAAELLGVNEDLNLDEELLVEQRHKQMLAVNPKYILKNHIPQEAIEKAEAHDFTMVNDLLIYKLAPQESKNIKLSCSS